MTCQQVENNLSAKLDRRETMTVMATGETALKMSVIILRSLHLFLFQVQRN